MAELLIDSIAEQEADETSRLVTSDIAGSLCQKIASVNVERSARDQLAMPADITIARWIKKTVPASELTQRRVGKDLARKLFRANGARVSARRILQFVQFDDVDVRVFAIDPDTGLPWGTPMFTFGVDEYSRAVMGANPGPETRTTETAVSTILGAMRKKNMGELMLSKCQRQWVQCGQFGLAILDNAVYNTTEPFKLAMLDLGVDYAYSKPHEPTNKSVVEGFNRTFKHIFAASKPGACVKKNNRDGLDPAMRAAKLTLEELVQDAMRWVVDEYMHTRGEDGRSASERWEEQVASVDLRAPRMDCAEFAEFILPGTLAFRASGGLERKHLRYQNDRLEDLRRSLGHSHRVNYRVNPENLEQIFVADPLAEEWFLVPCVEDPNYVRGLTERQHQLTKTFAREAKGQSRLAMQQLSAARDDMRDSVSKLETSRLIASRRQAFLIKYAFRGHPAARDARSAADRVQIKGEHRPAHSLGMPACEVADVQEIVQSKPSRLNLLTKAMDSARLDDSPTVKGECARKKF
ncbi:hypothetical protein [Variovorax sp. E3]|uniref:hypothetical protein n=1 Tax=Variovorax sp. E3 TaxID=1914993 RepID=UPI0018DEA542|nr:hypothetical protein [Variovorax sp. E3]